MTQPNSQNVSAVVSQAVTPDVGLVVDPSVNAANVIPPPPTGSILSRFLNDK